MHSNKEKHINKKSPTVRHIDPYGKRTDTNEYNDNNKDGLKENIIEGRNAVLEAIRAGVTIDKVFIAKGETDATLRHIAFSARETGAVVVDTDRRKLDSMSVTHAHQGVIAVTACAEYLSVDDILKLAETKDEKPLIVICEAITDPHNLGAIIRTCEAAGAHGVIIPKRKSAGLGAIVSKASSGAVYHVPVARVSNISSVIAELKKKGIWVFGASSDGDTMLWQTDFSIPTALVIGSEGSGISRLVMENCDFNISIPMFGKISSLNASVSAAILMYEALRQRKNKPM
jgi:23S rRNA (guanosine2251-2'-O)-methyltransferase